MIFSSGKHGFKNQTDQRTSFIPDFTLVFIDFGQFLIVYSDFSQIGLVASFPVESVDPVRFLKPYWEVTCTLLTSHNNN